MKFERIRNLREDNDLTQHQLGNLLHVSQQVYSNYENGSRNIPIDLLWKLADYYGVTIDYLVGRD